MKESSIERYLVSRVKKKGGVCLKIQANFFNGIPDRLCLMPKGRMFFVELKAPDGAPSKLQIKRIQELKKLGYEAYVVDNKERINELTKT